MAEISKRLSGAMAFTQSIVAGLAAGTVAIREVEKLNAQGVAQGEPRLALVNLGTGIVLSILITKPNHPETTKTETKYNSWTGRYDERSVKTPGGAKYRVVQPQ